jgi:polysaccharide biosynthesis/export protein
VRGFAIACVAACLLSLEASGAWSQVDPGGEPATQMPNIQIPGLEDLTMPPARRAESPVVGLPPLSGPVDPDIYRLGPGDVLRLQMWGRLSSSSNLQVTPEGVLIVPGVGTVQVSGRTLTAARQDILTRLRSQFRGVNMDIRLASPRSFFIYLTGQVQSPGSARATAANRVFDVIRPGALLPNGSTRRIEVKHADQTREIADLELFTLIGDQSLNPYLRDGDVINVPVATEFVYTLGALARPQRFELGTRDSLLTLFRLSGDPIPSADVSRALLLRWVTPLKPESLWVRLDEVYSGRTNPRLREGDRVYVYYLAQYQQQQEAFIYGEVNRPGPYPIEEGRHRLSDLVSSAGGFLSTADLSAIRVIRRNPEASEKDPELDRLLRLSREQLTMSEYDALNTKLAALREGYRVDWNRLQATPRELDILLKNGDVVRVERLVNSIRVDGAVRRPGILSFRPGLSISDYIRQAGGYTDRAWGGRVQVTRAVTGQTLPARNVPSLNPGDFIWVPEKPDRTAWEGARDVLSALGQVATVIIAIRSLR